MGRLPEAVIDQEFPVGRPTGRALAFARLVEQFLGSRAVRSLLVQVVDSASVGCEDDVASVGGPCREGFPAGVRSEPGGRPSGGLEQPDIAVLSCWLILNRRVAFESYALPVRRDAQGTVQPRFTDRANDFALPVEPGQAALHATLRSRPPGLLSVGDENKKAGNCRRDWTKEGLPQILPSLPRSGNACQSGNHPATRAPVTRSPAVRVV